MSAKKHLPYPPNHVIRHGYHVLCEKRRHERPTTNPALNIVTTGGMGGGMRAMGIVGLNLPHAIYNTNGAI